MALELDGATRAVLTWFAGPGLRIALVGVLAYVAHRALVVAVARMQKLVEDEDADTVSERERRARTLATIVSKTGGIAITAVAGVTVLDQLGVDIRPIVTAAGIGGLAVGFGAQNLVRDVISGFFLLVENQIRVGDVVSINGMSGLVESITLRITVLRDLSGTVHIIPNGSINAVSNLTKGWSRYVIDVGVAYKEDVDRVMDVLRRVGEGLYEDPTFRPFILEPPQVLGVDDFRESQVVIKVMVTTLPLKQWEVGREFRRRIKNTFDAEGIEIPFPHVSVYWGTASSPVAVTVRGERGDVDRGAGGRPGAVE
ncbi:MAG: mechanosensitive ion channel family protein [Clostridia bacterium]|nr:mechanosensitive ion channel family protein [Clostridia bacterium]